MAKPGETAQQQRRAPWQLTAAQRRGGAPSSAAAVLTVAALPGTYLIACGAGPGAVSVQQLQVRPRQLHVR